MTPTSDSIAVALILTLGVFSCSHSGDLNDNHGFGLIQQVVNMETGQKVGVDDLFDKSDIITDQLRKVVDQSSVDRDWDRYQIFYSIQFDGVELKAVMLAKNSPRFIYVDASGKYNRFICDDERKFDKLRNIVAQILATDEDMQSPSEEP